MGVVAVDARHWPQKRDRHGAPPISPSRKAAGDGQPQPAPAAPAANSTTSAATASAANHRAPSQSRDGLSSPLIAPPSLRVVRKSASSDTLTK